jgi:hypothetical protein
LPQSDAYGVDRPFIAPQSLPDFDRNSDQPPQSSQFASATFGKGARRVNQAKAVSGLRRQALEDAIREQRWARQKPASE